VDSQKEVITQHGFGQTANIFQPKKAPRYQMFHEPSAFDIFLVTTSATENEYENLVCNIRTPYK
jgi:hypothetical protein